MRRSVYCASKVSVALKPDARLMTWRTAGSKASGCVASSSRTTLWRSATHGPSYSSAATANSGAKSSSTTCWPRARARSMAAANIGA